MQGLSGMRWSGPSPVTAGLQIIRPFLGLTRREIERFAQAHGVKFRHDATNDHLDHERNRIRNELLPFIRDKFAPAVHTSVLRLMEIVRDESDLVAEQTARALESDDAAPFEQLPTAIQRRWLMDQCRAAGVEPSFELVEALRSKETWNLGPDRAVSRNAQGRVQVGKIPQRQFSTREAVVDLAGRTGAHRFARMELSWQVTPWSGDWTRLRRRVPGLECFDADRVGRKIRLRHWRPGDRFQPIGAPTPVKVQDLLTNLKVPVAARVQLTLAEAQSGEIFWIEGLRISEKFKVRAETGRCLEWRWRRGNGRSFSFDRS
jgi:tRNA(Ile)-lysidine synthase